jgi:hypothetical protein
MALLAAGFTGGIGCDDSARVDTAAARVDRFYVGDQDQAPSADRFADVPGDNALAIDFGMVDLGTVAHKYLFLSNTGRSDLRLSGLEATDGSSPDFSVSCSAGGPFGPCPNQGAAALTVTPGQNLVVDLAYGPGEVGADEGSLVVLTNAAERNRLDIDLRGQGVTPEIQVCISDCVGDQAAACAGARELCNDVVDPEALALDFGDSALGPSLARTVWVRNLGDRVLRISAVSISGGTYTQFSVDSAGFELAAGETRALSIAYTPTIGGDHRSTLEIASNDVNEGELWIDLRARGLAPRLCPDPLALDFGNVDTGAQATRTFSVNNCGLLDLELTDARLAAATSPDFSLSNLPSLPLTLPPGQGVELEVEYRPAELGSDSGGVDLHSNDPASNPGSGLTGTVSLQGSSVPRACDIQATPFVVHFGGVVQGELGLVDLIVSNVGSDDCTLERAEISQNSAGDEFSIVQAPAADTVFGPGDNLIVSVQYAPADLGTDTGVLSLFGDDKDGDEIRVDLNGEGVAEAICDLEIVPTAIWFGAVTVYRTKSMILQLNNVGQRPCTVTGADLQIIPFFAEDFSITSIPPLPFVIAARGQAGSQAEIEITMAPPDPSFIQVTNLTITVDDDDLGSLACDDGSGNPVPHQACVMVSGFAKYSDVEVVPSELDFGVVTLGCSSPERCVTVYNLGSQNLEVSDIYLEDPADVNFQIRSAPMTPHTLIAGGDFQVCLRYTPQDLRIHRNALYVVVDGDEVIVPIFGRGTDTAEQTDVFHQADQVKADVLFVIDCSGSMGDNQENLATNFSSFIAQAVGMDVDFHLGVVATEVEDMPGWTGTPPREVKPGHLVQAGSRPKILTNLTPDLEAAFGDNVRLGDNCSNHEAGLEGAWMALSEPLVSDPNANAGFLREDAKLYLIMVSDEPDQSNGSVDFYVDFFMSIKGYRNTEMMSVSAICTSCDSDRYWDVTVRTGGICEPIDTADWAQSLANLGIDAFSAIREFPLSRPADAGSISVTVNGLPVDRASSQGSADGWSHYADSNTVYFGDDVVPDRGDRIEVSYTATCY